MASPYTPHATPSPNFNFTQTQNAETLNNGGTPTPSGRGRPRGGLSGAKRGRKPRGGASSPSTPHNATGGISTPSFVNQQYAHVHWALPTGSSAQASTSTTTGGTDGAGSMLLPQGSITTNTIMSQSPEQQYQPQPTLQPQPQQPQPHPHVSFPGQTSNSTMPSNTTSYSMPSTIPTLDTTGLISFASVNPPPVLPTGSSAPLPVHRPPFRPTGADDDGEGEDELLPAMADDDYSAQLSWQSQSKDNLKCVLIPPSRPVSSFSSVHLVDCDFFLQGLDG
jgi:transcription initiation factor TFIID subunit 11